MSTATVRAPSNIALIKYWGARDLDQAIPYTPSISMTLQACHTVTTARFHAGAASEDRVFIADGEGGLRAPTDAFRAPVAQHLDRLRAWADVEGWFEIATRNSFPSAAGLASSASGFAALTLAVTRAMGRHPSPEQASVLARQSGSGSAARSVMGGYVEWPVGNGDAPATQRAPHDHWDLRDVIAIVETKPKSVPSREGHQRALTSPFFEQRLDHLADRLDAVREALQSKDMQRLGEAIETEGVELHLIAMSSRPPVFYWAPATLAVLEAVRTLRSDGVAAYATMDAGANVHVICPAHDEPAVVARLKRIDGVQTVLRDGVGAGPQFIDEPLLR